MLSKIFKISLDRNQIGPKFSFPLITNIFISPIIYQKEQNQVVLNENVRQ